jgi:hypothetical protein
MEKNVMVENSLPIRAVRICGFDLNDIDSLR